jgi:cysteine-rich repeat protein
VTSNDPLAPARQIVASGVGVAPLCPDGFLDDGEACDDGNTVEGDGCSVDCAIDFGAQSDVQRRCIAAVNRGLAKIARAQAAAALRCLGVASRRSVAALEARTILDQCLEDVDARVAAVSERAVEAIGARCPAGELPELALGDDPLAGLASARDEALGLFRALFGEPSQVVPRDRREAAACQRKALRRSTQLFDVFGREFQRALGRALDAGRTLAAARSDAELSERIDAALAGSPRVERAVGRLTRSVDGACGALPDLPQALPACAIAGAEELASCVAGRSRCSACQLALGANPGLSLACDRLDDGAANGTCP